MNSEKSAEKLLNQMKKVRRNRVKKLKAKINSGKYRVKTATLVKALIC